MGDVVQGVTRLVIRSRRATQSAPRCNAQPMAKVGEKHWPNLLVEMPETLWTFGAQILRMRHRVDLQVSLAYFRHLVCL